VIFGDMWMNLKYPVYIVSRGRWETRLTSKALERMNVPYYMVIDEDQYDQYASVIDPNKILIMPKKYTQDYNTCDDATQKKSVGPGAARNFCWDHSIDSGFERHWVMDDNIDYFYRLNENIRIKVLGGNIFRCMEDFSDRYENVYISGPHYRFFIAPRSYYPPFVKNTRIYSCLLIKNNIPYRWRGRYNEDTDLCLQVLKDGFCTIQFNAFLSGKTATQQMEGGNTEEFYDKEGTYNKSKMLVDMHPDVAKLVERYGRWHHYVNYEPFKKTKLIRKKDIVIKTGVNNYGMILKKVK
jgi:hypothetical protein